MYNLQMVEVFAHALEDTLIDGLVQTSQHSFIYYEQEVLHLPYPWKKYS